MQMDIVCVNYHNTMYQVHNYLI